LKESVRKKDSGSQARICKDLRKKKQCEFFWDDKKTTESQDIMNRCLEIEEFISECKRRKYCPYFVSQLNSQKSDIVLAPYTYIVDPVVREHFPLETLQESIMILDEAHNFPDQCSDHLCIDVPFRLVEDAIEVCQRLESTQLMAHLRNEDRIDLGELAKIRQLLQNWNTLLHRLEHNDPEFQRLLSTTVSEKLVALRKGAEFLFDLLKSSGIAEENVGLVVDLLASIIVNAVDLQLTQGEVFALEMIRRFMTLVFQNRWDHEYNVEYLGKNFAVCLTNEHGISLFCFTAAPGFKEIVDYHPHTIILTSGTLSPIESFAEELDQPFPIRLEGGHVAHPSQVFVGIIGKGTLGGQFQFTYSNRRDANMKRDLVASLRSLYEYLPAGILTFVPSFSFLEDFCDGLVGACQKKVFVESRDATKTREVLAGFQRNAADGAALLAVCRGKLSEGLDFTDDLARCVSIVGIPFPNSSDFKVNLKKQWLEERRRGSGSKWYTESALRAVNQAIGRAIRHKDDYAAVVLMDERFLGFRNMISKWIRPSIHEAKTWDDLMMDLKCFFIRQKNGITEESAALEVEKARRMMVHSGPVVLPKTISLRGVSVKEMKVNVVEVPLKMVKRERSEELKKESASNTLMAFFSRNFGDDSSGESKSQDLSLGTSLDKAKKGRQVVEKAVVTETPTCVYCKVKGKKGQMMKCRHWACQECLEYSIDCPECKKKSVKLHL
jgi:regulator of telomere elongation helicase 1